MFFKRVPEVKYQDLSSKDIIIDVRERSEYNKHHLPRAQNVPLQSVKDYQSDKAVYVICASGARSKSAVKILRKKGIEAYNIKGGMRSV